MSALEKMNLNSEYTVVSEYSSHLAKLLSFTGYMGRNQYRTIYAKHELGNIMIIKTGDSFRFTIESGKGPVPYSVASDIETSFRQFYVESVLEEICSDYQKRGISAELTRENDSFAIRLGPDMSISVNVSLKGGLVHEDVNGVTGSVCELITSQIEAMLAEPCSTLTSKWKTEYYQKIDNKIIQVLDLRQ